MRRYYTPDETRYPKPAFWRDLESLTLILRIPVFCYFLLRRICGLHLPAIWGESDAEPGWISNPDAIPRDILDKVSPHVAEAASHGFTLTYGARLDTIGGKEVYWLYLLNETRSAFLRIQVAVYHSLDGDSEVTWSCHSFRDNSNAGIHTMPTLNTAFRISGTPASGEEDHGVPEDIAVSGLISAHLSNIESVSDARTITEEVARQFCVRTATTFVSRMIRTGYYRQLSPDEIERITNEQSHRAARADS